jgi:hypothetical protein
MITIRRLVVTAAALSCHVVLGSNISSSAVFASSIDRGLDPIQQPPATSAVVTNKGSWFHALDGVPFLLARKSKRKLTKNPTGIATDALPSEQRHRHLAFGDYADPTFSCPATTTCPLVCVNSTSDCPIDATCALARPEFPDHSFELCNDGTCADTTLGEACDAELESPCTCGGLGATCPKIIDEYDSCFERFGTYYDENAICTELEEENLNQVDFNGVAFKSCYIPLVVITILMFGWCAFNQRIRPVEGSCVGLECAIRGKEGEKWSQTGYKRTVVGSTLHGLVMMVYLAFQGLLLFLTIEYCKL